MIPSNANNVVAHTVESDRASREDKYLLQTTNGSVNASTEHSFKADLTNASVSQDVV